jgi:hypothetical protein
VRTLSLDATLLLLNFGEGGNGAPGAGSLEADKGVREVSKDVDEGPDLLMAGGRGRGTFSLPSDGKETLIQEIFALSELAKELRFRRRSSSGSALVLTAPESFLESILGLDSVLVVSPLSRIEPAGKKEAVLFALLIEVALDVPGKLSFLTGMTMPSALRLIRENPGVKSVTKLSIGSCERERGIDEPEVEWRTPLGIDETVM